MKDIELPPLPDADVTNNTNLLGYRYSYSAILMQSYARAAVEADRAQRVPDGWKLVPVEPTEEMLCAGDDVLREAFRDRCIATRTIYDAMLASTPAPAQQEPTFMRQFAAAKKEVEAIRNSPMGASVQEAVLVAQPAPQPVERKPMTEAELKAAREGYDPDEEPDPWAFRMGVYAAERHHGIRE